MRTQFPTPIRPIMLYFSYLPYEHLPMNPLHKGYRTPQLDHLCGEWDDALGAPDTPDTLEMIPHHLRTSPAFREAQLALAKRVGELEESEESGERGEREYD